MDILYELIEKEENSKKKEENEMWTRSRILHDCSHAQKEEVNHSLVTYYIVTSKVHLNCSCSHGKGKWANLSSATVIQRHCINTISLNPQLC